MIAILLVVLVFAFGSAIAQAASWAIFYGGIGYGYGSPAMAAALNGKYAGPEYNKIFVNTEDQYPNTGEDASVAKGTATGVALVQLIREVDSEADITFINSSMGSIVGTEINRYMIANGMSTDGISMVLLMNPSIGNGGIKARFSSGMTVPFTGITGGSPTQADGAQIVSISGQYDLISDAPAYVFGPFTGLAWTNAVMGFIYVHPNIANVNLDDPRNITVSNGNLTSVLVYTPQLPITMPLRALGIPGLLVDAIDRILRPLIESAYIRPDPSDLANPANDPSNLVPLTLAPTPDKWPGMVQRLATGLLQAVLPPVSAATLPSEQPATMMSETVVENMDTEPQDMLAIESELSEPLHDTATDTLVDRHVLEPEAPSPQEPEAQPDNGLSAEKPRLSVSEAEEPAARKDESEGSEPSEGTEPEKQDPKVTEKKDDESADKSSNMTSGNKVEPATRKPSASEKSSGNTPGAGSQSGSPAGSESSSSPDAGSSDKGAE